MAFKVPPQAFATDVPQRAFASCLSAWLAVTLTEKSAPPVLARPASECSVSTLAETSRSSSFLFLSSGSLHFFLELPLPLLVQELPTPLLVHLLGLLLSRFPAGAQSPPNLLRAGPGTPFHSDCVTFYSRPQASFWDYSSGFHPGPPLAPAEPAVIFSYSFLCFLIQV